MAQGKQSSLWGGGFSAGMHPALAQISESLGQDAPLGDADCRASAAYARALGRCGVLSAPDAERLASGLETLRQDLAAGRFVPTDVEDIHTALEAEITVRLGELGGRLHTGRSRNDQVSTAFRLALSEQLTGIMQALRQLQRTLVERAQSEVDTLLPAYTHLQRAQPIRLAHWLMAQFWPLQRDLVRLQAARAQALILPLGAGAVSGHPFGLDRAWLAAELGFSGVTANSLDAVGDRDFAVEAVFACALVAVHLSRLAEDLVLWSSAEFAYVRWPDGLATGSSLMPNKKNPDLVELVRGRAAATVGDVVGLLVLLKGLPSSYQRDLQEDKPPVWRCTERTRQSLVAMGAAMAGLSFQRAAMAAALTDDTLATEAADVLVSRGVPFRQAHHIVASCVAAARQRNIGLKELGAAADFTLPAPLVPEDLTALDMETAVERRSTAGGTARAAVLGQIEQALAALQIVPSGIPGDP